MRLTDEDRSDKFYLALEKLEKNSTFLPNNARYLKTLDPNSEEYKTQLKHHKNTKRKLLQECYIIIFTIGKFRPDPDHVSLLSISLFIKAEKLMQEIEVKLT